MCSAALDALGEVIESEQPEFTFNNHNDDFKQIVKTTLKHSFVCLTCCDLFNKLVTITALWRATIFHGRSFEI